MAHEQPNGRTSTTIVDPIELQPVHPKQPAPSIRSKRVSSSGGGHSLRSSSSHKSTSTPTSTAADLRPDRLPSPVTATETLEAWNDSRTNIYRVACTFWSFIIMGLNDATYGAIIPYLEDYYHLSYTIVALVFLSPFVGYNVASVLNNTIHMRLGQRGVGFLGASCHLVAYVIICLHPPYPVLVVAFSLAGLGNGLEDAGWNAWIGAMANANEVLGFLHGFYGIGGVIAPLIATAMITKGGLPWYYWYYCMVRRPPRCPQPYLLRHQFSTLTMI